MAENRAVVELILQTEGAIQAIRQYRAEAEAAGILPSGGGAGGGTGLVSGGASVGGGGTAPNLGAGQVASPTGAAQSKASTLAGTAAAANNDPHVGGGGGGASQGGATPAKPESLLNVLASAGAYNQAIGGLSHALGDYSRALNEGSPYSSRAGVMAGVTLGLTAIGAGIGSMLGNPALGAIVGGGIAEATNSVLDPIFGSAESDVALRNAEQLHGVRRRDRMDSAQWVPGNPLDSQNAFYKDVNNREATGARQGMPLSENLVRAINKIQNPEDRAAIQEGLRKLRYTDRAIARLGLHGDKDYPWQDYEAIGAGGTDDPWTGLKIARAFHLDDLATSYEGIIDSQSYDRVMQPVWQSRMQRDALRLQTGKADPDAIRGTAGDMATSMRTQADFYRRAGDLQRAEALENSAEVAEGQASRMAYDFDQNERGAARSLLEARGASRIGSAGRNLENAIYGGQGEGSAAAELASAMRDLARATRENTQKNQADTENAYRNRQIGKAEYDSKMAGYAGELDRAAQMDQDAAQTDRARRAREFQRGMSDLGYSAAEKLLNAAPQGIYGSLREQSTWQMISERDYKLDEINYIDANLGGLTDEVRREKRTRAKTLRTEVMIMDAQIKMAQLTSGDAIRQRDLYQESVDPMQSLMGGAGGLAGGSAQDALVNIHRKELAGLRRSRKEAAQSWGPDSEQVMGWDNRITSKQIEIAGLEAGLGKMNMSGFDAARMSDLSTQMKIAQSGYGSAGDIRQAAEGMAKILFQSINDINQRESNLRGEGKLTGQVAADLAARRGAYADQALQLQQMAENGWDQRLISDVYNAPGTGLMIMPHLNHREAANNGISNPAFGGRKAEMDAFRSMAQRFRSMLGQARGTGSPDGMASEGMSTAEKRRVDVEVNVTVNANDAKGRPLESSQRVLQDARTVDQLIHNPHAKRPSG